MCWSRRERRSPGTGTTRRGRDVPTAAKQSSIEGPAESRPDAANPSFGVGERADALSRVHETAGNGALSRLLRGEAEARDRLELIRGELGRPGEELDPA